MMILPVAKAVAAAFAGSLAFSTGRNMLQTQQLLKATDDSFITDNTSVPTTVSELQTLQRKQLLQLYLQHCEAPTELSTVAGDWHGVLLKNNGLVRSHSLSLIESIDNECVLIIASFLLSFQLADSRDALHHQQAVW